MTATRRWTLACVLLFAACDKGDAPASGDADAPVVANADADAAAATAPTERALPEAEAVLAKAVAALGGKDKLEQVKSFYYEGRIEILGQNIAGDSKIWWKNGDFYTEQDMPGIGTARAGKLGDEVWADDPITGLRKLEGAEAEQHVWASSMQLAIDWQRYFVKARTIAERTEGEATILDVELESKSGGKVTMSFDAKTGLQVAQAFEQVTPMGKVPVTVRMEDYRDVDGVKIVFKQVTDLKIATAVQTITKIELNPEVSEARFAMPRSGADVVEKKPGEPAQVHG